MAIYSDCPPKHSVDVATGLLHNKTIQKKKKKKKGELSQWDPFLGILEKEGCLPLEGPCWREGQAGEAYRVGRGVGMHSSDSRDIHEGRERGEGEHSWSEVRDMRGEKGELRQGAVAAAEAMSRRSSGMTITGTDLPGLF